MPNTSAQTSEWSEAKVEEKLRHLIGDIEFAMLTTHRDGILQSCPMTTQKLEGHDTLWFFIGADSHTAQDIRTNPSINLSYGQPSSQKYVSISGEGKIVRDAKLEKEFWKPLYKAWFPEGLEDPNLALLKVDIRRAEYWDVKSGLMVQLFGYVKSVLTHERFGIDKKQNTAQHGALNS